MSLGLHKGTINHVNMIGHAGEYVICGSTAKNGNIPGMLYSH